MTEKSPPSNFIKVEEKPLADPITAPVLYQMMLLSQQNLLDACNDIARCLTLLTRDKHSLPDVVQKIGAVNISTVIAVERLAVVIERLKNPESLGS